MPNDYSPNSPSRRKAQSLNAQDAEVLIISTLAHVRSQLSQKQVNQVQKVLDAAVVNPAVKEEAAELARRSVTQRAGSLVIHDPRIERSVDKVNEGMIWVREEDKRIRLDYEKLLGTNALEPITDNPDEAEYLKKVANTLKEKGVWLRVGQERLTDPRSFVVWLSLGPGGDQVPAGVGLLDREAILGNQLLAANYHKEVTEGSFRSTLKSEIYRLGLEVEDGRKEHNRLIRRHDTTYTGFLSIPVPFVPEISDALGGADLPDLSIWNVPQKLLAEAWDSFYADKFERAQAYLILGAVATNKAAQKLQTYAEDSIEGAALGASIAQITAVTCSIIVTITTVGGLAVGAARGVAVEEAATVAVNRYAVNDAVYAKIRNEVMKPGDKLLLVRPPGTAGNVGRFR